MKKDTNDEIQLFTAEHAARLIGGDQQALLIVMKARCSQAWAAALTWINSTFRAKDGEELDTMAASETWPMLEPQNRGAVLFYQTLEDTCTGIVNASTHAERWAFIQQARTLGHDFSKMRFHRQELARWIDHCGIESEYLFEQSSPAPEAGPDFSKLATPQQLIDAFGAFTGMNQSWFAKLEGPLLRARLVPGRKGRNSTPPFFCPHAVMVWLIDPNRRKGTALSPEKGWELLEKNFSKVYAEQSMHDPRQD